MQLQRQGSSDSLPATQQLAPEVPPAGPAEQQQQQRQWKPAGEVQGGAPPEPQQQVPGSPWLPPSSAAALGFGAAWAALRSGMANAAAADREARLRRLLAPLEAAGGAAAREASLYAAVFCSAFDADKQVQHLQRMQAEAAAGPSGGGVRAWMQFVLRALGLEA